MAARKVGRTWINWSIVRVVKAGNDQMDVYEDEDGRFVVFNSKKVYLSPLADDQKSVALPRLGFYAAEEPK